MSDKVHKIAQEIVRLSEDEQDPPVRMFFKSLSKTQNENLTKEIINDILEERPEISEKHLPYLIYASLQSVSDFSYDKRQPQNKLLNDLKEYREEIIQICRNKNVSTNIIERYIYLQTIVEIIGEPVTISDLGSSLGLGIHSLNTDRFSSVDIDPRLEEYSKKNAEIEAAYGIDIQEPDLAWAKACYLPENRDHRKMIDERMESFNEYDKFNFVKGDILALNELNIPKIDVAWTSNVLYQIEGDTDAVEESIRSILSQDGIWIDADYRYDDEDYTGSHNPYVAQVRFRHEWHEVFEVLQSSSDVVEGVQPGEDFDEFVSMYD